MSPPAKLSPRERELLASLRKKALIEAQSIIANNQAKPADPPDDTPSAAPETTKNVLTTTQWLSIISIIVSLVGVYYKREKIKKRFDQKTRPIATIAFFATSAPTIACFTASVSRENQTDGLNILFVFYNESGSSFLKSRCRKWNIHYLG